MLGSLKKPFSVIGISETWLTDCTAELVNITGYNFVSNHRKSKTGGGVGIYLQNDLQYKLLNECKLSDRETIESLFVEITVPHLKISFLDLSINRQIKTWPCFQTNLTTFFLVFLRTTNNVMLWETLTSTFSSTTIIHQLKNLSTLFSHAFIPVISNPTRLTSYSATLIDNIFTNNLSQNVLNGIALNDSSDHLPVLLIFLAKP